ncbi:actin-related protein 2-like isoform X2 [Hylaeus volcanicus]|uniref:actin-related protein 2-like isoform X2 n=1 Tax=Hylaeus volcanicus TaxID=313075 RepID=UPI0023B861EE|nr:actin-related protein 2-like isoform X2 [Hylaeus volcanicus]
MVQNACILDIGSQCIRGGYSQETIPLTEIFLYKNHTVSIHERKNINKNEKSLGSHCIKPTHSTFRDHYKLHPIVKDGRIVDSRQLENHLIQCFTALNRLSCNRCLCDQVNNDNGSTDRTIVTMSSFSSTLLPLLSPCSTSTNPLQELVEYLFYTKNVKHCQFVSPLLMSLYGVGCVSGLVVDIGQESSRIGCVAEGQSFADNACVKLMKGGHTITEYLQERLCLNHSRVQTPYNVLEKIKRQSCFVSFDFKRDLQLAKETSMFQKQWILPDSTQIILNEERFTECERFFNPTQEYLGFCEGGEVLPDLIGEVIQTIPLDLRRPLLKCIVLSGGGGLLSGFPRRLEQEIRSWYTFNILSRSSIPSHSQLMTYLLAPPERQWLAFRGASLYAQLSASMEHSWISRSSYEEIGLRAFDCQSFKKFHATPS